jgi:alkyldihydroxyacetonephosphate synthase
MENPKTYRDILKWGDKREQPLEPAMKKLVMEMMGLKESELTGNAPDGRIPLNQTSQKRIPLHIQNELTAICGNENVSTIDSDLSRHSYGKFYGELLKLRLGIIENSPEMVIYPRNSYEISSVLKICTREKIAVVPFGGGSSVTGALQFPSGGICIDLTRHMNKIIEIDEINHTVRLEAGIYGPELEKKLNEYKEGFTCGHFPQSFEFSTPGGWIAARGAGTFSTGYGKIEDMVLSLKVVCPSGIIETRDYPADAQGVNLNWIFMGSEGVFGIIAEASLKIRKYRPQNICYASFVFKTFEQSVEAMRKCMQAGYGKPHLFRISDPRETDIAFKLKGFENSFSDKLLNFLGYKPHKRVLMFVAIEGLAKYAAFVRKNLKQTARQHGGLYIGQKPTKKWLKQRYSSAYARDPLMDAGLITDTIETAISWRNLLPMWEAITAYLKQRPKTLCMTHISHVYENGANLYITYISPVEKGNELNDFSNLHKGLVGTILSNKGSLSHHHGIGRVLSPWFQNQVGSSGMSLIKAIKKELDPVNIMNPGGMLGLD